MQPSCKFLRVDFDRMGDGCNQSPGRTEGAEFLFMSEPLKISETARKAELYILTQEHLEFPEAINNLQKDGYIGRIIQQAIDSVRAEAVAEKDKEIARLKQMIGEYVEKTDPSLSCDPTGEHNSCGTCKMCLLAKNEELEKQLQHHRNLVVKLGEDRDRKIAELEKQVSALRDALQKSLDYQRQFQYEMRQQKIIFTDGRELINSVKDIISATPAGLSKKFVKREVLEQCLPIVEFVVARNPNWIEATESLFAVRKELES